MNRSKIMALILTGSMVIGGYGLLGSSSAGVQDNIVLASSSSINSQQSNEGVILSSKNNFELLNSPNGKVIAYVSGGEMITYESANTNGYYKVKIQETGETGYIKANDTQRIYNLEHTELHVLNENGVIINVSTKVDIRESANMNSSVVGALSNNQKVQVLGKQGQWYKVKVNGITGFIYEEYVGLSSNERLSDPSDNNTIQNKSSNTRVNSNSSLLKPINKISSININNLSLINNTYTAEGTINSNVTNKIESNNSNIVNKIYKESDQIVPLNNLTPIVKTGENQSTSKTTTSSQTHSKSTNESIQSSTINQTSLKSTNKTTINKSATVQNKHVTAKPVTKESAPTLNAKSVTIAQGSIFNNSQLGAVANEGATITYKGNVNTSTEGTYKVVITATNSQKQSTSVTETVTVEGTPVVTASNVTINYGEAFTNSMLKATATEGASISYSGTVNTNKVGTYNVTVTARNNIGKISTKTVQVTVKSTGPVITANNGVMKIGTAFNESILGISATEDGQPINYTVNKGTLNVNIPGNYNIIITASANGKTVTKTVTVTVKDSAPTLNVGNITVNQGSTWSDSLLHATATSVTGANLFEYIEYSGTINTSKVGTQPITVTVTDSFGERTTKVVYVTVKPVEQAQATTTTRNVSTNKPVSNKTVAARNVSTNKTTSNKTVAAKNTATNEATNNKTVATKNASTSKTMSNKTATKSTSTTEGSTK